MPRFMRAVLGLIMGFLLGVAGGALLVSLFSGNVHDRSLETSMTAAFVTGPLGAIVGMFVGAFWKKRPAAN